MDIAKIWQSLLSREGGGRIVYIVLDGVGGLPDLQRGGTELQVARTPHLDQLAREADCGLLEIVGPGITPGSGPGHLALFGYDPFHYLLGRGVLSALGIDFELREGDVAARANFATVNTAGHVTDRRAGRIATERNRALCQKIQDQLHLDFDGHVFFQTVSEHRAVLVLRGPKLSGDLSDTDPQRTGVVPYDPEPQSQEGRHTAEIVRAFLTQTREILAEESPANMILLRGFEQYQPYPSLTERFGLHGVCSADYPMYRGVSRLLGLDVPPPPGGLTQRFDLLRQTYGDRYDFYFLHVKHTDSRGEDADFDKKVAAIEEVDALMPRVTQLNPDVLVVTADHSTPSVMGAHSWHPVPVLLRSRFARSGSVDRFDEYACLQGSLGRRPAVHLMGLALAHAGRLQKYGA
ncbi:MAG: 2,3-bisphosphoglycerate-independent phosphoglycerate mutase [Candidatus Binatia bacterium]